MGEWIFITVTGRHSGWDKPVNIGPEINTTGNESFPFACRYGKLYFSSDGQKGFGGKDIFYTQEVNGAWISPVHLDSAINSPADDFGLVIDSTFENGYFSSNRKKTDDIFSFSSAPVEFDECEVIGENNYCFTFYDEKQRLIDTLTVVYQWDFGDGVVHTGKEVDHCFPGPGKYTVKLTITDELTGDTIAKQVNYDVDLENIRQAYINSMNIGLVDSPVSFEALVSDLRSSGITDYFWDLGDGFKPGGYMTEKIFNKRGTYDIRLGLFEGKDSLGLIPKVCVIKKIRIFNNCQKFELKGENASGGKYEKPDSGTESLKTLQVGICFMDDLSSQQRSRIGDAFRNTSMQEVMFDLYGITSVSCKFLDVISGILKDNPDLDLEMILHSFKDEIPANKMAISEIWARELVRYFKSKENEMERIHGKGSISSNQLTDPVISEGNWIDGVVEFIFFKNL